MTDARNFAQRLRAAFLAAVMLAALSAVVSIVAMRSVSKTTEDADFQPARSAVSAEHLRFLGGRRGALSRQWSLTRDESLLSSLNATRAEFGDSLDRLTAGATTARERGLLDDIARRDRDLRDAANDLFTFRVGIIPT